MIQRLLTITFLAVAFVGVSLAQDAATHTVRPGETLYRIATTNGMTVDELKRLNGLTDNVIKVGQVLRLTTGDPAPPRAPGDDVDDAREGDAADDAREGDAADDAAPGRMVDEIRPDARADDTDVAALREPVDDAAALTPRGVTTHVAQQGETLYSIAADRGTKAYILFTLNEGISEPIEPGTPVIVPASTGRTTYEVRRGDTLSKIAAAHGTTVAALRRANALPSDALEVGQQLTLPGAAAGDDPMQGGTQTYAVGSVTVFPETYAGRVMAGGTAYDPAGFVVAHRELPFDTVLIVENAETGRASFARVADRGPVDERRLMEISPALADEIGVAPGGQVRVRLVE